LPHGALSLLTAHLVVALVALVAIGGATRVMEAGLACPDWPLCYGVLLPGRQMNLQVFLEWFHRLDAFLVGIALLVLSGLSLRWRAGLPGWLPWSAAAALALVAVQGGLGALTVIRLLEASTITAHLGVALLLVLLLSATHQGLELHRQALRPLPHPATEPATANAHSPGPPLPRWWFPLVLIAGLLLLAQCVLGGAMASQWSADRCFAAGEACRWLLLHRLGAWPALAGVMSAGVAAVGLPSGHRHLQGLVAGAVVLVVGQVCLGVLTLRLHLTVPSVTVAHQLVAALLVAMVGAIWARSLAGERRFQSEPSFVPSPSALQEAIHG
jgi:cytochrome c oxidase assembly protein subunit 15